MPDLEAVYEKQDDIPEAYVDLFTERDGKFELTGVNGIKTQADFDRNKTNLDKERGDHKDTKDKLGGWLGTFGDDADPAQIKELVDKIPELEAAAEAGEGELPQERIDELVEKRVNTQTAQLNRQITELTDANTQKDELIAGYEASERRRTIHDAVRSAMVESKVVDTAHEDVLLLAERVFEVTDANEVLIKDEVGAVPGATPQQWLQDMQEKRPHWWPASEGGGAGGSGTPGGGLRGDNPWTHDNWNMTAQGVYVREHGMEKATDMAKQAGTTVGGPKPLPKK